MPPNPREGALQQTQRFVDCILRNRHDLRQFLPTRGLVRSGWSCAPEVVSTSFCWWVCWITEVALLVTGAGLTTYVDEVDNVDVYIIRNADADLHGFPSNSGSGLYLIRMRIRIQLLKFKDSLLLKRGEVKQLQQRAFWYIFTFLLTRRTYYCTSMVRYLTNNF
jgi:hypothetical protein